VGLFFDGGFEEYLAYFFDCIFNEAVFISSLYKVCDKFTRTCIEDLIKYWALDSSFLAVDRSAFQLVL